MQRIQAYLQRMEDLCEDPREIAVARKVLENLYDAIGQKDTGSLTKVEIESFIAGITASDVSEGAKLHFSRIALDFYSFIEEIKDGTLQLTMPSSPIGLDFNVNSLDGEPSLELMPGIVDKTCTKCNFRQSIENKFCSNCGHPSDEKPAEWFCSQCGAENLPDSKFCNQCGEKH